MKKLLVILTIGVALAAVTLWVARPDFGPANAVAQSERDMPAADLAQLTPQQTVQAFYDWYLDYSQTKGNVIVDKAYHDSPYLTQEYVQSVDDLIASFDKGGFDPFLQAQDIPEFVAVQDETITGDRAVVLASTSFEGQELLVDLVLVDGVWRINHIDQ